jgi:hypothetical protein
MFPLSFQDWSLWLAITATILLVTSEILSPYYGKLKIYINKKRLRNVALATWIVLLITFAVRIANLIDI